jgi:hypothetical protein
MTANQVGRPDLSISFLKFVSIRVFKQGQGGCDGISIQDGVLRIADDGIGGAWLRADGDDEARSGSFRN